MSRPRARSLVNLAVLGAVEVGALVFLQRLGGGAMRIDWHHLGRWLATTSPEDALAAVLRVLALAGAYWLLITTVLYLLGRLGRIPTLVRGVGWVTVPGVRRLVDAAVAMSIVGGSVLGGGAAAHAASGPPPTTPPVVIQLGAQPAQPSVVGVRIGDGHVYVPVPAGDPSSPRGRQQERGNHAHAAAPNSPTTSTSEATTTTTTASPPASVPPLARIGAPATAAPGVASAGAGAASDNSGDVVADSCVVARGDNLWVIAAQHLAKVTGRPLVRLGRGEIARYWMKVVEANQHKLPSGNPSLIHAGEHVVLPAVGS